MSGTRFTPDGGSGGGSSGPNVTYAETVHLRDAPTHGSQMPETLHLRDAPTHSWKMPETLHLRDTYSLTAVGTWAETPHLRDAGSYGLTNLIVGRSGTPDTDQIVDIWVDQAAPTVNHGNESILAKGNQTASTNERRAYLEVDLTRLTGQSAGAAGGSLTFIASTSNAILATSMTVTFIVATSRQISVESTHTWNTGHGVGGTSIGPVSVATGAAAAYTVTFTTAQLNTMIGKYVIFIFTTAEGALPDTVTILSRDNATASNRPKFTAALIIP